MAMNGSGNDRGYRPKQVFLKRQPRSVHPSRQDEHEEDALSDDSRDETSSPQPSNIATSNSRLIRTRNLNRRQDEPWKNNRSGVGSVSLTRLLIGAGIILGVCALVAVPTSLLVVLTRNPKVPAASTTTTTTLPTLLRAYWNFDSTANDLYGTYNGALTGGASYSNTTYFGYGGALALNSSISGSLAVSSPFLNLSYTSFTVDAWIYGVTLTGDNAIFSQCACNSCQDQCLYLIIRNYKMYMGFTLDDIVGVTSLSINTWYHVAFVYDYSTYTQSIYLQGNLEKSKTSAGPYQGQSGTINIGLSSLSSTSFYGYIDNLRVINRARSSATILSDATLVAHYSFDGASLAEDVSANKLNGTLSNANVITGKVGQGLSLSGSGSYLQAYGFYELGQTNKPYSFALWVYPYSVAGGILFHAAVFQYTSTTWCRTIMGLTYLGQISVNTWGSTMNIVGPFLSVGQWTHLVFTFSITNGQTLYVNGVQYATTGAVGYGTVSYIFWLTIGYDFGICNPGPMYSAAFLGSIDEVYVYRRELNSSDVYSLANP